MNKPRIVFRADGNSQIGLGHVIRSLALADMLKDDFTCIFIIQESAETIYRQIRAVCSHIIVLPITDNYQAEATEIAETVLDPGDIVVLDGYGFSTNYQRTIKQVTNSKLVCIDDICAYHFVADAVINHSGDVTPGQYTKAFYTQLLLGPSYALLRAFFLEAAKETRNFNRLDELFINMGGADPENHTLPILREVSTLNLFRKIHVVIGSAYQNGEELRAFAVQQRNVFVHANISATEVCAVMRVCSAAICPPSSVAYEYCSVGGLLLLHQTASNQQNLMQFLVAAEVAIPFSKEALIQFSGEKSIQRIRQLIQNQKAVFTGNSKVKLIKLFQGLAFMQSVTVRKLQHGDINTVFEWANEPDVRRYAYNPNPITWPEHTAWFATKINSIHSVPYILFHVNKPMALVRFDIKGTEAVISYLIDKHYREQGLGTFVLLEGIIHLKSERNSIEHVTGYVMRENVASCRAFEKANFRKSPPVDDRYPDSYQYTLSLMS